MIKSFLDSLEDPERPLLGPNYWLLTKIGLIMPKNRFKRFLCIFWHELAVGYMASAIYDLYLTRENLDLALSNLRTNILALILIVKSNSFVFEQKQWVELIAYITESDKYERNNCDYTRSKIIDTYTKYCRRLTYSYTCLILITCAMTITTPLFEYLSSASLRHNLKNGAAPFPHIMSCWVPFDKDNFPGNCIVVVWHVISVFWGAGLMPSIDTTILVTMVFFGSKLELLRERSKHMLGSDGKGISDEEANRKLRELHHTHVMLLKYLKVFNGLISPIMFTYVIILSLMLCGSAYQLTTATTVFEMVLLMEYLIFSIAQMFMFCWLSSYVLDKHEQLMSGPYESEWWCANARQRKYVVILTGQFSITYVFTAGPFTNLTLATFVTIMKGAYSYFTLLRR